MQRQKGLPQAPFVKAEQRGWMKNLVNGTDAVGKNIRCVKDQ